jgi:hypothetical protein
MTHLSLGDLKVAERLLQARASPDAVTKKEKEGKTPLVWVCKENDADSTLGDAPPTQVQPQHRDY